MAKVKPEDYVISDLHLGHDKILGYCRPWFKSIQDHDAYILNEIGKLKKNDLLWVLGDVAFRKEALIELKKTPCQKILVPGNHDIFSPQTYQEVFIRSYPIKQFTYKELKAIFSHIPLHPYQTRWDLNIHGHLHTYHVEQPDKKLLRYINVSCEVVSFKPKQLGPILERFIQGIEPYILQEES